MKGSIRKRGNTYQYRFRVKDPNTGNEREYSKGGFKKEKDAETAMILAMAEYETGSLVFGRDMTFKELTDLWLKGKQGEIRESTMYSYTRALNARILPKFGKKGINDIKPIDIHNYYMELKEMGMSKRYIQYVGTIIGAIFKKAVLLEKLSRNPVENVDKPKMRKNMQKSWTAEQATTFLKEIKLRSNYYLTYYLAFHTGMRIGEVLGLHWSDIDFEKKVIHVQHSITLVKGKYIIGTTKTLSSNRFIPISDNVIDALNEHKNTSRFTSDTLVFVTKHNRIIAPYTLRHKMKVICEELELPLIRFHDIRRTHTTILIDEGVSPKVMAKRLGHSSVAITLNIYTDVYDARQVEASEKIDEILSRGQFGDKHKNNDDKTIDVDDF